MPNPYPLLYRIGFTPWDGKTDISPVYDVLNQLPVGRLLDLGCGTGHHAVAMAERGWEVTGVDAVEKPLKVARERAGRSPAAGRVTFVRGDVTRLTDVLAPQTFNVVTDMGCFHGLNERQRLACLAGIERFTIAGSRLIIYALAPRRGIGPSGLSEAALNRYAGTTWHLDKVIESGAANVKSPLGDTPFRWYLLSR